MADATSMVNVDTESFGEKRHGTRLDLGIWRSIDNALSLRQRSGS